MLRARLNFARRYADGVADADADAKHVTLVEI